MPGMQQGLTAPSLLFRSLRFAQVCKSSQRHDWEKEVSVIVHRGTPARVRGGSRVASFVDGRLPEMSNFYCHPGRAGGPPSLG